jgi:type 1 glutamine amidotransferase
MMRIVVAIALLAAACSTTPTTPTAPGSPASTFSGPIVRVLMLTATAGFRHDAIATAREVMATLAPANGLTVNATEDLSAINAANLAGFDVVMFALTSGELAFTVEQRSALLAFVNNGKGFVGTHSATDTLREWPEYGRLVGSYVVDHPWTQPARVLVEDASHPATGIRETFALEEEFYVFGDDPRARVRVLMRLDASSVGATGDYPLAWVQSFGSGRSYYNALGHFPNTWRDSRYQQQVIAAIRWASGK